EVELPQYAAVLGGVRRAMDDWVAGSHLREFLHLIERLGLHVGLDCLFIPIEEPNAVSGLQRSPTTRHKAVPLSAEALRDPRAKVHVVVGRRADWVNETLAACWYSVAVEDRIVFKPLIDRRRLGTAFGYP